MHEGGTRPSRTPTGIGKALDSLPIGSKKSILGETDHGAVVTPKGSAGDFDCDYAGNVIGPQSKPVVMG